MSILRRSSLLSIPLFAACALAPADSPEPSDSAGGKADQISGADDPSGLLGTAERRLAKLIGSADVGQSFGVPDELIPYPDTYWPMVDNGVAVQWLEKDGTTCDRANECLDPQPSPLEKLVAMTAPADVDKAVKWEVENHGSEREGVSDWWGHCPGWVASAMLNAPVRGPIWVKKGSAGLEACEPEADGCTKFEIGDLNGLSAEAHEGAQARFIGARCDTEPGDIERDEFGRIVRNGKGCKGLNAGSLLIVLGNRLKNEQKPFGIDAQNEFNTEQIWNQPAYRYTVNRYEELTEAEAANLVETGGESKDGDGDTYAFNDNAEGFVLIDVTLDWVSETFGPNLTVVSGASTARQTRMVAVIELDAEPSDPEARIIGGEYLDDASVGANRLRVAPFAWIAIDVGSDFRHNPYVKGTDVKNLLAIAKDAGTVEPDNTCHDVCETGISLEASCGSCVETVCAEDDFCCTTEWDSICVDEATSLCGLTCN